MVHKNTKIRFLKLCELHSKEVGCVRAKMCKFRSPSTWTIWIVTACKRCGVTRPLKLEWGGGRTTRTKEKDRAFLTHKPQKAGYTAKPWRKEKKKMFQWLQASSFRSQFGFTLPSFPIFAFSQRRTGEEKMIFHFFAMSLFSDGWRYLASIRQTQSSTRRISWRAGYFLFFLFFFRKKVVKHAIATTHFKIQKVTCGAFQTNRQERREVKKMSPRKVLTLNTRVWWLLLLFASSARAFFVCVCELVLLFKAEKNIRGYSLGPFIQPRLKGHFHINAVKVSQYFGGIKNGLKVVDTMDNACDDIFLFLGRHRSPNKLYVSHWKRPPDFPIDIP